MKAVLFDTLDEAQKFSSDKAKAMGCVGVTEYWWGVNLYQDKFSVSVGDELDVNGVSPDNVIEIEIVEQSSP